jgi:hypothetical protein
MGLVSHKERCPNNQLLRKFVEWWDVNGPFAIVITNSSRTDAEQLVDYGKGRKQLPDGSWVIIDNFAVVTNALRAEDSAHGHDAAIDCQPVRAFYSNGLPRLVYLGNEEDPQVKAEAIRRLDMFDDLAKRCGLETGEKYPGICDRPHACDPDWRKLPVSQPQPQGDVT